jgi:hypothetical protein
VDHLEVGAAGQGEGGSAVTVPATPAPPPWTLAVPRGARTQVLDDLAGRMRAGGLGVTRRWLTFHLGRRDDPPPLLATLDWRMTAAGLVGSAEALRDHWQTWPGVAPILHPGGAEAARIGRRG